jgi:hypothetical protein
MTHRLLLLASVLLLTACAAVAPSGRPGPDSSRAIADLSLILEIHPRSQARFDGLALDAQRAVLDDAYAQLSTRIRPEMLAMLGSHEVLLDGAGYPDPTAMKLLQRRFLASGGFAEDPPKGCQWDEDQLIVGQPEAQNEIRTIKCWFRLDLEIKVALPQFEEIAMVVSASSHAYHLH